MVGVEPPAPPAPAPVAAAARAMTTAERLAARGVRPRKVSARRSWPPGCGRSAVPPPAPGAGGDGEKAAEEGRAEDVVAPAAVSTAACNGAAPQQPEPERVVEEEERKKDGGGQVPGDGDVQTVQSSSDGQGGGMVFDVVEERREDGGAHVPGDGGVPSSESQGEAIVFDVEEQRREDGGAQALGDGGVPLSDGQGEAIVFDVEERREDGGLQVLGDEGVPLSDGQGEAIVFDVEDERREDGGAQVLGDGGVPSSDGQGEAMVFDVMPLAFAVPQSCVIAAANGSMENGGDGMESPMMGRKGHMGSNELVRQEEVAGHRQVIGTENGDAGGELLERKEDGHDGGRKKRWLMSLVNPPPKRRAASAIRKFPPGCGMSAVTLSSSRDEEELLLQNTPISVASGSASVVNDLGTDPVSRGCSAIFGLNNSNVEVENEEASRAHNGMQESQVACDVAPNNFADTKHGIAPPRNFVTKASPSLGMDERMNRKRSPHEEKHVTRTVEDGKVRSKHKISLHGDGTPGTPMRNRIIKNKEKSLEGDNKIKKASIDDVEASRGEKMRTETISYKSGVEHSTNDMKRNNVANKLKSVGSKYGKHVVTNQSEENDDLDLVTSRPIVQALMSLDVCPWTNGRKSIANVSHTLTPRSKLKNKKITPQKGLPPKAGSSKLVRHDVTKDHQDPYSEDDGNSKALVMQSLTPESELKNTKVTPRKESPQKVGSSKLVGHEAKEDPENPYSRGDDKALIMQSLAPKSKLKNTKVAPRNEMPSKVGSSKLIGHEEMEDYEDPYVEDDGNSEALVTHKGKKEICVILPPCAPGGDQGSDARSRVRKLLKLFHVTCRMLVQAEENHVRTSKKRIDIEAAEHIKQSPIYTKLGPIVGDVPGVEIGDEFQYRVELSIVGLHRLYQGGIDTTKVDGVLVATSIVASGGYSDELSSSDELIYTGSGGQAIGKKEAEDQKLVRGNLALKNCIETETPVRVIRGFKGQSKAEASHSKSKQTSIFTYDGLYRVKAYWQEGPKGSQVFKYKLERIAGQPELALHVAMETRKVKTREGLCLPDISQGSERIPICVIDTIDGMRPAPFKYITKVIYPDSYAKESREGCGCTDGCSDSNACACAVKNGGEIPFNSSGAIVHAKALVYECGPLCRCPPTCHNRVSQHGIQIPLEIFKTGKKGWGVRSLSSISSGSFVCEYAGELLEDTEAEERKNNDEYLFDIGHNYDDEELWKGLPTIPGLTSATSEKMDDDAGFTIDAAECGNVGRFINHSCSPNLYAQNVLWDHDDKRMPHIMFFAAENIKPLEELTYHYNYAVGQVHDKNSGEKVKHCLCGSSDCCGRLY